MILYSLKLHSRVKYSARKEKKDYGKLEITDAKLESTDINLRTKKVTHKTFFNLLPFSLIENSLGDKIQL